MATVLYRADPLTGTARPKSDAESRIIISRALRWVAASTPGTSAIPLSVAVSGLVTCI